MRSDGLYFFGPTANHQLPVAVFPPWLKQGQRALALKFCEH